MAQISGGTMSPVFGGLATQFVSAPPPAPTFPGGMTDYNKTIPAQFNNGQPVTGNSTGPGGSPAAANPWVPASQQPADQQMYISPLGAGVPATPGSPGAGLATSPNNINSLAQLIYALGSQGASSSPYLFTSPQSGSTPDQAMANSVGDNGYLQAIVASGGMPTSSTQTWQDSIAAQQRNTQRQAADLSEQFGVSGNRFSNAFGTAMTDYYNQSDLNQNAMLAQLTQQSLENAANRTTAGATTLANNANSNLQQLSGQDFQSQQLGQQQQLQAALAEMQNSGSMTQLMAQLGAQGAQGLQQGAITGAQGLFGAENSAAGQNAQLQLALQQLGLGGAQSLSQLYQSNLGLGNTLGSTQYSQQQSALNNAYQEFLRQQPQYSPLLPYLQQGANQLPSTFYPQYQPSQLGSLLGGIGGILGGITSGGSNSILSSIISGLGGLFNSGNGAQGTMQPGGSIGGIPISLYLSQLFGPGGGLGLGGGGSDPWGSMNWDQLFAL